MLISLRAKLLLAFALVAGVMGGVTLLAITALRDQARLSVEADLRQDRIVDAMATLRAVPYEAEGLVLTHLGAADPGRKHEIAGDLMAADTREALALADLRSLAEGPEQALIADLALQASQAADLRQRLVAISTRNATGQATVLATQEMPLLRQALHDALQVLAAQTGAGLAAARAEAALNAMAAAQKNALLNGETDFVTGQLATAAIARADLAAALAQLLAIDAPGQAELRRLVEDFRRLDTRIEALLRDGGAASTEAIYQGQLRPLDQARLSRLDDLGALIETGRREVDQAALQAVAGWQSTLVLLADTALVLGFSAVVLGLGKIGRGLEAAVRLAERMAHSEVSPPTWVERDLSGRLTAALVQISAGQTAVIASLEALAAGRPLRTDLPERMRERLSRVAERMAPPLAAMAEGVARAQQAVEVLGTTIGTARQDAEALRDGAEALVEAGRPREGLPALDALGRHALVAERHVATLIHAESQVAALAEGLGLQRDLPALRRIA